MAKKNQGISGLRPTVVSLAVASCFSSNLALANPTGAQVVNGQVSMIQNGNVLQITNSPNSIINWQTFSIGANEITRFLQQSQASAVLNRVAAGNPSQILGTLQSNGRVFLVNPSGIVFGAGAVVDVAGLVATSLNLSNQDFLAGKLKFTDVPGAGSIINQGNITTSSGGQVYLVGPAVENKGIITSPNGEVVLAAGNSVELVNPGTPNLRVEISAPDNEARNLGQIAVDTGRAGIYAGLITNSGTIRANSAVAEGGRILLKATKNVTLESSSILDASGNGGGRIEVLANDSVKIAGKLDASAPVSGDGGFIETSAHSVNVASGTAVRAGAANGNKGTWLIDPDDFVIAAYGGNIDGATLASQLNAYGGTNVSIATNPAAYGGNGDIAVNDAVSWNSAGSLTLTAMNNVDVNAPITNTGNGGLNIYAGWDGTSPAATPAINPGIGHIYLPAPIMMNSTSGKVVLVAGGDIEQHAGTGEAITASSLVALSLGGVVELNDAGNKVNVLAGGAKEEFSFTNSQALTIGSISTGNANLNGPNFSSGNVNGIYVTGRPAAIGVTVTSGDLTVSKDVRAVGTSSSGTAMVALQATNGKITVGSALVEAQGGGSDIGAGATVTLIAGTDVAVASGATVRAVAGNGSCCSAGGGSVSINAGNALSVANGATISATGGNGDSGGTGTVTLAGAGGVTVDTGASVVAKGGNGNFGQGGYAYINICAGTFGSGCSASSSPAIVNGSVTALAGSGAPGGNASIQVTAGGDISVAGTVTATGGNGANASFGSAAQGGVGQVTLNSTGGSIDVGGSIVATGGAGGNASSGDGSVSAYGGGGIVNLAAANDISVGGSINATGGAGGNASSSGGWTRAWGGGGSVNLTAGNTITVAGSINATGGAGGVASAGGSGSASGSGGFAGVQLAAQSNISVTGAIGATGGAGGIANGQWAYAYGNSGSVALISSNGSITAGGINVRGGNGGTANGSFGSAGGGWASAFVSTSGPVVINGTGITVAGGNAGSGPSAYGGRALIGIGQGGLSVELAACEVECGPTAVPSSVTINGNLIATGGNGTAAGSGGSAAVVVNADSIAASGAVIQATGGTGASFGGIGGVILQSTGGITATGSTIEAYGSTNSGAFVALLAGGGDIAISGGEVEAQVGIAPTGMATVAMIASGNITVGGNVAAAGSTGSSSGISMSAGNAIIGAGGLLATLPGQTIALQAANGIGVGSPILLTGNSSVFASNSVSGDIFLSSPTSNFTVGSGSGSGFWNLTNAPGGNVIVIGNDVTLGSGAPTMGGMFITALNNATVDSAGYSSSGVLGLSATNVNVNGNVNVGDLALIGLNEVNVNGVAAQGNATTTVVAGKLNIVGGSTPAMLGGVTATSIVAGEVNVTGGASDGASAEIKAGPGSFFLSTFVSPGVTTGNVNLKGGSGADAYARIFGDPDVGTAALPMEIGGVINMNTGTGTGAYARIEAASMNSIHIDFSNLTSGGFFVDGVDGAVSSGQSGFFAGGQPAVPGQNFFVTYGTPVATTALPPVVQVAANQVIAATTQQANVITDANSNSSTDGDGSGTGTGDPNDKEKKQLPICGK